MITSVRITFTWTGPDGALELLREAGILERRNGDDYAWTVPLEGDVGPGTPEERAGRAEWMAQDVMTALIQEALDENEDPVWFFVHLGTEHLGTITRWPVRAREIRRRRRGGRARKRRR